MGIGGLSHQRVDFDRHLNITEDRRRIIVATGSLRHRQQTSAQRWIGLGRVDHIPDPPGHILAHKAAIRSTSNGCQQFKELFRIGFILQRQP
ncbi:hypothetical protein D3C76_1246420 [compost metagenome]